VAAPTITKLGAASSKTSGASVAVSTSATVAIGDYVVAALALDPSAGAVSFTISGTATIGSVTVREDLSNGSGTSGVRVVVAYAKVTGAGTVTQVSVSHPTVTARSAAAFQVQGADGTTPIAGSGSGTGSATSANALATIATGISAAGLVVDGIEATSGASPSGGINDNVSPNTVWSTQFADSLTAGTSGSGSASNISLASLVASLDPTDATQVIGTYGPTSTASAVCSMVIFQAPSTPHVSLIFADRRIRQNHLLRR